MYEPLLPDVMAIDNEKSIEARPAEIGVKNETEVKPSAMGEGQAVTEDEQTTPVEVGPSQPPHDPAKTLPAPAANRNGKSSTPTRPPYKPQFSASTQMVLSRLNKSTSSTPSSPAPTVLTAQTPATPRITYDDVKRRLVESFNTSLTLPLPTPSPKALSAVAPTSAAAAGAKRKRATEDEGPRRLAHLPSPPEPKILTRPIPRPPVKRKRVKDDGSGHPMCAKCKRISWTDANLIIPCACGEAWHQICHEPEIPEVVARNHSQFKCNTCVEEEKEQAKYQRELAKYREAKNEQAEWKRQYLDVERRREKRLTMLPDFIKPELVGFEAGDASSNAKREYFSQLRKNDLVNLLSFSEQIQPGLLVDILVSVSKKHPDLPIFSSPDWAQPRSQGSQTHRRQNGTAENPAPPRPSKKRSKTGGVRKILKTAPAEVAGQTVDDEDDDVLPESWPKAGHGLYARLKPEKEDLILFDDNDEEAFSHFMVDKQGRQIMEPIKG